MKNKSADKAKNSRLIAKMKLNLEILKSQEHIWKLRAKAKRIRIAEVEREIKTRLK